MYGELTSTGVKRFIPMYHGYLKACAKLTDEEFGKVIRALLEYAVKGTEPEGMNDKETIAFDFMSQNVARPTFNQTPKKSNTKPIEDVETLKKLLE